MKMKRWKLIPITAVCLVFFCCGRADAQAPTITSISTTSGPVGTVVGLNGTNFGASQGNSTVSLNGTAAASVGWTDTIIDVLVPRSRAGDISH